MCPLLQVQARQMWRCTFFPAPACNAFTPLHSQSTMVCLVSWPHPSLDLNPASSAASSLTPLFPSAVGLTRVT